MSRKYRRDGLTVSALTLAFGYNFFSIYQFGPFLSVIAEEIGMTAAQAGFCLSSYFIGYLGMQLPGGMIADRKNPKKILLLCVGMQSLFTFAMSFFHHYGAGILLRILAGMSGGCIMPACAKVITELCRKEGTHASEKRTRLMGILLASPPLGITLANTCGVLLGEARGWRSAFCLTGLCGIGVLAAVLFWVKKDSIPKNTAAEGIGEGLKVFFTDKRQVLLGICGFLFMAVPMGFASFANMYLEKLGIQDTQSSLLIICYSLAGIFGSVLSGKIAGCFSLTHRKFLIIALIIIGMTTILFSGISAWSFLLMTGILYGFFSYLPSAHFSALAMERAPSAHTALAASAQNLMIQSAGLIIPPVVGAIGYGRVWHLLAGSVFVSALLLCFGLREKNPHEEADAQT